MAAQLEDALDEAEEAPKSPPPTPSRYRLRNNSYQQATNTMPNTNPAQSVLELGTIQEAINE